MFHAKQNLAAVRVFLRKLHEFPLVLDIHIDHAAAGTGEAHRWQTKHGVGCHGLVVGQLEFRRFLARQILWLLARSVFIGAVWKPDTVEVTWIGGRRREIGVLHGPDEIFGGWPVCTRCVWGNIRTHQAGSGAGGPGRFGRLSPLGVRPTGHRRTGRRRPVAEGFAERAIGFGWWKQFRYSRGPPLLINLHVYLAREGWRHFRRRRGLNCAGPPFRSL